MKHTVFLFLSFFVAACGHSPGHDQAYDSLTLSDTGSAPLSQVETAATLAASWGVDSSILPYSQDSFPTIPIFIITCDRVTDLKKAVASYHKASSTPVEIIIHDNNSTHPDMLNYLLELEASGVTVVRHAGISRDHELNAVGETIRQWYLDHDAPYFVVTDPDIEMEQGPGTVLQLYAHLLRWHPETNVVGPMLRVDDLPDHYPLKHEVIRSHNNHFRGRSTFWMTWDDQPVLIQRGMLDTTFAMYRKGFGFHRLNQALQVNEPFRARHLDWYLDPNNLADDQLYYIRHASGVAHWGGSWLKSSVPKSSD